MQKGDFVKLLLTVILGMTVLSLVGLSVWKLIKGIPKDSDYQDDARELVYLVGDSGTVTPTPVQEDFGIGKITPPIELLDDGTEPELTPTPEVVEVLHEPGSYISDGFDLSRLLAVNKDIIGWIRIPGTEVDYPLLNHTGSKYINTAYDGKTKTDFGSIFTQNRIETTVDGEENLVIYGHNMRAAGHGMFTSLMQYKKESYQKAHPTLELYFPDGLRRYKLFAVYNVRTSDSFSFEKMAFGGKADFEKYISDVQARSVYQSGIQATASSRLVTLTTCDRNFDSADGRLIVVFIR